MKKLTLVTLVLSLILSACGGDSHASAPEPTPPPKNLFSVWTRSDDAFIMDLTSGAVGSFTLAVTSVDGAACQASVTVGGDGYVGAAVVTLSVYIGGGDGDPGCATLNGSYQYTIDGGTLSLCGASCETYR